MLFFIKILPINYSYAIPVYLIDQQYDISSSISSSTLFGHELIIAQSFIPSVNRLDAVSIQIFSKSEFSFSVENTVLEIRTDDEGFPSDSIIATSSTSISVEDFGLLWGRKFFPSVSLTPGATYYIVGTGGSRIGCTLNDSYLNGSPYYKDSTRDWIHGLPASITNCGVIQDIPFLTTYIEQDIPEHHAHHDTLATPEPATFFLFDAFMTVCAVLQMPLRVLN